MRTQVTRARPVKAVLLLVAVGMVPLVQATEMCTFWNKLESAANVANSEIGPGGTFVAGSFLPGKFVNAYFADQYSQMGVLFPKEVIPAPAGAIEFWGKLTGYTGPIAWGQHPTFVGADDSVGTDFRIHFNGNDGASGGGLCGHAGRGYTNSTSTGDYWNTYTYEDLLGGQVEAWHHYALVWKEGGIPGVDNGKRNVALFLDGALASTRWHQPPGPIQALVDGYLGLVFDQGWQPGRSVGVDNLKIWPFAQIDYSHRFEENYVPEPGMLAPLSLAAAALLRRPR